MSVTLIVLGLVLVDKQSKSLIVVVKILRLTQPCLRLFVATLASVAVARLVLIPLMASVRPVAMLRLSAAAGAITVASIVRRRRRTEGGKCQGGCREEFRADQKAGPRQLS